MHNTRTRKTPELATGDFFFDGTPFVTPWAQALLNPQTLQSIIAELQNLAKAQGGIDYLQVFYQPESQQKIWVIDATPRSCLQENKLMGNLEYHHFTILTPEEY